MLALTGLLEVEKHLLNYFILLYNVEVIFMKGL